MFQDKLPLAGRVKKISRLIFGTGEALKAVTITANSGFVRAAKNKVCIKSKNAIIF